MRNHLLKGLLLGLGLTGFQPATAQYQWDWVSVPTGTGSSYGAVSTVDAAGNSYLGGAYSANTTVLDFGNGITLPAMTSAAFVTRYDALGRCQWASRISSRAGAQFPLIKSIATDPTGNVLVSGLCTDSTQFGTQVLRFPTRSALTERQGFVGKLNAAGQWQWVTSVRSRHNTDGVEITALGTDAQGNVYAAGNARDSLYAAGFTLPVDWRRGALFVARLAPTGQWQWARGTTGWADPSFSHVTDLKVDANGDARLVGVINQTCVFGTDSLHGREWVGSGGPGPGVPPSAAADVFVARIDAAGQWRGAYDLGTGMSARLVLGASGTHYVAGYYDESVAVAYASAAATDTLRGIGTYIAHFGPQGQRLGLRHTDKGGDVEIAPDGTAYLMSTSRDSLTFGARILPPRPDRAFYVAGLSPANQWIDVQEVTNAAAIPVPPGQWLPTFPLDLHYAAGALYIHGAHEGTVRFGAHTATTTTPQFFLARLSTPLLGLPATAAAASALHLFPNPAHGTVQLSTPTGGPVQMFDAVGHTVRTAHLAPGTSALSLQGLAPGFYTVRAGVAVRKLVVE